MLWELLTEKHVVIRKPKNGGSFFYNYKHTHSIILMAIAGPNYECLYADVSSPLKVQKTGHNASVDAKSVRDTFKEYFVNEGAVGWQWQYC